MVESLVLGVLIVVRRVTILLPDAGFVVSEEGDVFFVRWCEALSLVFRLGVGATAEEGAVLEGVAGDWDAGGSVGRPDTTGGSVGGAVGARPVRNEPDWAWGV